MFGIFKGPSPCIGVLGKHDGMGVALVPRDVVRAAPPPTACGALASGATNVSKPFAVAELDAAMPSRAFADRAGHQGVVGAPIQRRGPAGVSGIQRDGRDVRKAPVPPEWDASEAEEFGSEVEGAGGLRFEVFVGNVSSLGGGDHVGNGAGGAFGEDGETPNGGNILEEGKRLEASGAGAGAVEVGGVEAAKAILGHKTS